MEMDDFGKNAFKISVVPHVGYPRNGIGSNNYFKTAQNFHVFEFFRISFTFQQKSCIKMSEVWGGGQMTSNVQKIFCGFFP